MKATDNLRGASALLGAAMTYASFGLLIREMAKMFGNNAQVAFRFGLAFLILVVVAAVRRRSLRIPRHALVKSAFLGVAFGLLVQLFTISVTLTTLANSVFLLYAGSIVASLVIGTVVLKEKLTAVKVAAIGLALLGLAMYSSALLTLSLGVVAAVASGLLDGVTNSIRKTLKGIDRNTSLFYQFAFGTVTILIAMVLMPEQVIREVSLLPLVTGAIFAVLLITLGNLLLYGFQHFDVNVGTVILATELVFATILGWVFFQEVPAPNEIAGGLIIFAASVLSAVDVRALLRRVRAA